MTKKKRIRKKHHTKLRKIPSVGYFGIFILIFGIILVNISLISTNNEISTINNEEKKQNLNKIDPNSAQDEIIQVVTSTALIKDFVDNIGGDAVKTTGILVEGSEDPHTYEPTQSEITALVEAEIFILMGREGLEPWWEGSGGYAQVVLEDNPDLKVVKIMNESMIRMDPLTNAPNPHGWTSPIVAKEMCRNIYLNLTEEATSAQQDDLRESFENYMTKLDGVINEINGNKTKLQGTKVVMHHPAMMYLYDLLGIERVAIIEEQHDVEPSAQHIQEIKEIMESSETNKIVHQTNLDHDTIVEIAKDTNSTIILSAPLIGMEDYFGNTISSYLELIRANIQAFDNPLVADDLSEGGYIDGLSLSVLIPVAIFSVMGIVILLKKKKI